MLMPGPLGFHAQLPRAQQRSHLSLTIRSCPTAEAPPKVRDGVLSLYPGVCWRLLPGQPWPVPLLTTEHEAIGLLCPPSGTSSGFLDLIGSLCGQTRQSRAQRNVSSLGQEKMESGLTSSWLLTFVAPHLLSPPHTAPSCCCQQPTLCSGQSCVLRYSWKRHYFSLYGFFPP